MSGKPYPEGAARVIEIVGRLATLEIEERELFATIDAAKARLTPVQTEARHLSGEFEKLIQAMDLHAPGNYGYPGSMAWFLLEIHRQAKLTAPFVPSPVTESPSLEVLVRSLAENARFWSKEAIETAVSEILELAKL